MGATNAQHAITKSTLNTAEPMIVPSPTSLCEMKTPTTDVESSGAEPPAAIHVAPATSSLRFCASQIASSAASKYSSQTIARPRNMYSITEIASRIAFHRSSSRSAHAVCVVSSQPGRAMKLPRPRVTREGNPWHPPAAGGGGAPSESWRNSSESWRNCAGSPGSEPSGSKSTGGPAGGTSTTPYHAISSATIPSTTPACAGSACRRRRLRTRRRRPPERSAFSAAVGESIARPP